MKYLFLIWFKSKFEVMISLDFLFKVMLIANFGLQVDFK